MIAIWAFSKNSLALTLAIWLKNKRNLKLNQKKLIKSVKLRDRLNRKLMKKKLGKLLNLNLTLKQKLNCSLRKMLKTRNYRVMLLTRIATLKKLSSYTMRLSLLMIWSSLTILTWLLSTSR